MIIKCDKCKQLFNTLEEIKNHKCKGYCESCSIDIDLI